jgi:hypothetical protein
MSIEQAFAEANYYTVTDKAIKGDWFIQCYKESGAVLNHSMILERKGFDDEARQQLLRWAEQYPCFYRYLNIRPKWGLDLSIDFFDHSGRTFEVIHWEFDSFDYDEIVEQKHITENIIFKTDFDDFAEDVWNHKEEWYNLDYDGQTRWRCERLGIIPDRWKMVVW